ncbi:MAG TPA: GxxExxY protein [Anaerolineales bacterium]|nr:GxxExxY protein [Anaerolineales bacterium]
MSDTDKSPPEQPYVNPEYAHSEITSRIIAAAQQVHRNLGPGFMEILYQRAFALELIAQDLDFSREVWINVHYRDKIIGRKRVDFLVENVMVEIKAKGQIEEVDIIQTLSYLKASGYPIGLLLNFGTVKLEIKRLIHTPKEQH